MKIEMITQENCYLKTKINVLEPRFVLCQIMPDQDMGWYDIMSDQVSEVIILTGQDKLFRRPTFR